MNYNFTDRVRKALATAREEAVSRGHDHVDAHHILLGILRADRTVAIDALAALDIDVAELYEATDPSTGKSGPNVRSTELPYTGRAKKVLELAMREARHFNHTYVGTEHLLLGLMRQQGLAARLLSSRGATLEAMRAEVSRLTGSEMAPSRPAAKPRAILDRLRSLFRRQAGDS